MQRLVIALMLAVLPWFGTAQAGPPDGWPFVR